MQDVMIAAFVVTMLAGLYCGLRAWRIFSTYLPAASVLLSSDYKNTMPNPNDPYTPGARFGPDSFRGIKESVRFRDIDGNICTATIKRQVANRYKPDGSYGIWYDPADTSKATLIGPGYWLGWMAACFGLAIGAVDLLTKFG